MTTNIGNKELAWTVREYIRTNKDCDITDEQLALGLADCLAEIYGYTLTKKVTK